jgi:putative heme-binding domain-containing protein
LLAYLNSTTVIDKTLVMLNAPSSAEPEDLSELLERNSGYGRTIAAMHANHPDLQKIHYAYALRTMKYGWTFQQRQQFFDWFEEARKRSGGASYQGFIDNIRDEAWENVGPDERAALRASSPPAVVKVEDLPQPKGPGQKWTVDELVQIAEKSLSNRSFENGKTMFAAAQCGSCHRFFGAGGAQGPDLSNVAGRFSLDDLCDAIVNPNKVISDQYRSTVIETSRGKIVTGRIVGEQDEKLVVQTNPLDPSQIAEVAVDEVMSKTPSPVSPMPEDLLNRLNRDEVLDLLAYMLSRGDSRDVMFAD